MTISDIELSEIEFTGGNGFSVEANIYLDDSVEIVKADFLMISDDDFEQVSTLDSAAQTLMDIVLNDDDRLNKIELAVKQSAREYDNEQAEEQAISNYEWRDVA